MTTITRYNRKFFPDTPPNMPNINLQSRETEKAHNFVKQQKLSPFQESTSRKKREYTPQENYLHPTNPALLALSFPLPKTVFGKAEWEKYIGDVGKEPLLPQNIIKFLKKNLDTYILVLVPKTVDGIPLSLNSLGEFVQKPKQGHATTYRYFAPSVRELHGATPNTRSHWIVLSKDLLPFSQEIDYEDQEELVAEHSKTSGIMFTVPTLLDVAVCIFMEYIRSKTRLYSETCTCTKEINQFGFPLNIGLFSSEGLFIGSSSFVPFNSIGMAGFVKK